MERLIVRVRQMMAFGLDVGAMVESLMKDDCVRLQYSRDDIYLAYKAAQILEKHSNK